MKPLKKFEDYLKEGFVKKQSPDKSRSNSLKKVSKNSYNFLKEIVKKIGVNENNSNIIIKSSYDVIMELIRSKMFMDGYNTTGAGAHKAEVCYLRNLNFKETEVQFINQLRYFRNGIIY